MDDADEGTGGEFGSEVPAVRKPKSPFVVMISTSGVQCVLPKSDPSRGMSGRESRYDGAT